MQRGERSETQRAGEEVSLNCDRGDGGTSDVSRRLRSVQYKCTMQCKATHLILSANAVASAAAAAAAAATAAVRRAHVARLEWVGDEARVPVADLLVFAQLVAVAAVSRSATI